MEATILRGLLLIGRQWLIRAEKPELGMILKTLRVKNFKCVDDSNQVIAEGEIRPADYATRHAPRLCISTGRLHDRIEPGRINTEDPSGEQPHKKPDASCNIRLVGADKTVVHQRLYVAVSYLY